MPSRWAIPSAVPVAVALVLAAATRGAGQPRAPLTLTDPACAPDRSPGEVAAALGAPAPPLHDTLHAMAAADDEATRRCGLRGLAAVRDADLPAVLREVIVAPAWRDDLYLVARWAAFAAGGPDAAASAAFAPLVERLAEPAVAAAAGDDGVRLLGEIASPGALPPLRALLTSPAPASRVDAALHALARQGDTTVRAQVTALGRAEADGLVTNATYEQARRIGAAAFFLLAAGDDTRVEGLRLLTRLTPADQADAGAWAMQTLCERAVRRPADAPTLQALRAALAAALDARGVAWAGLRRGAFTCPPSP